jgi:GNAT superfamily N-acetyltransferase
VTTLHFIRYRPEYQEQVLALHRSAMEGMTHGMTQQEEEADLLAIERIYLDDGGEFLIGLLDDEVVAMGGFKLLSDSTAELKRMRIASQFQGRGYGSQLLRELESLAFQRGFQTLCLETAKARNLTLAFYRKHAYQETGRSAYGTVETVKFAKMLGKEN